MSCKNVCKLCPNLIISDSVLFDPATNSLDITIPNNGYRNCEKVCIVVAQTIPASTTINALVNIVVNDIRFPLQKCNCTQAPACEIKTRTKYSTRVLTNTVSGVFRLLGNVYPSCPSNLSTLPTGTTTTATTDEVSAASITPIPAYSPEKSAVATTKTVVKNSTKKEVATNE